MNVVKSSKVCSKERNYVDKETKTDKPNSDDSDKGEDFKSMINRSKFIQENSITLDACQLMDDENFPYADSSKATDDENFPYADSSKATDEDRSSLDNNEEEIIIDRKN